MSNQSENKICQNCKGDFQIEPEDFNFYEKIKVPPPTFCPECRLQRKMIRRNERTFYKINCASCSKEVISMYDNNTLFTIYCNDCWWGDGWDSLSHGEEYDFDKPFFEQFYALSTRVPRVALFQKGNVNSPYTNHSDHNKNCYLSFNNGFIEDSMYCKWGVNSRQIVDCYSVFYSELMYESLNSEKCNKCVHAYYSKDCLDSSFIYNCRGCHNCFLSSNLRNRSYVFENKQLTKDEYEELISEINLENYREYSSILKKFKKKILPDSIRKYAFSEKNLNSTGDIIYESKNLKKCFHVSKSENCAYSVDDSGIKDSYDAYEAAFNCELQYDCHACNRVSSAICCSISYDCNNISYTEMSYGCSNLFGCIGLRDKKYCVLNKQYSKEEYEKLVPKIIEHMKKTGEYGEFFPTNLSPFFYNETIAQEYFPLTEKDAIKQGYKWKNREKRNYKIDINSKNLLDDVDKINQEIVGQAIECAHKGICNEQCTQAFKIISDELQFYKRMNLPIPRLCPNCRHFERLRQMNPIRLWHRQCMCEKSHPHHEGKCEVEFETSYAPERPEIVYCEKCYQSEVY